MPPESPIETLETITARLAAVCAGEADETRQVLVERACAIQAIAHWVAAEQRASRTLCPSLANRLRQDLESGAAILARLLRERESARVELAAANRDLQTLRGLGHSCPVNRNTIDCRG